MAISTGTGLALAAGGALLGAKMTGDAAKDAAAMQVAGGDRALAQQLRMFELGREDMGPYREAGYTALKDIERLMPMFTQQFGPEQLAQYLDPSMDFRMRYGTQATERLATPCGRLQNLVKTWHQLNMLTHLVERKQNRPTSIIDCQTLLGWGKTLLIPESRLNRLLETKHPT